MTTSLELLSRRVRALEKEIKRRKQPQLATSSIEDGALLVNQLDGTPGLQVGKQYDDTQMAASLTGPTPPTPTDPIVSSSSGGALVLWDGTFVDDVVAPLDFTGVDVVASQNPAADPIGTPPLSRIISARGGGQFLALDPGTWYVWTVARTASGKASLPSDVQSVQVTPAVSDGLKPAPVPNLSVISGPAQVILSWVPPTTNENGGPQTERVTYDIYVGEDVGSAQIVSHDVSGTMAQIRTLADGTKFDYFEPQFLEDGVTPNPLAGSVKLYYFWIVAKDSDGAALPSVVVTGSMDQLASADIRAGSITASMFAGVVILGSTISTRALDPATGQLVGPGIDLTPDGFFVYDQAGSLLVEMPNDPSRAKVWRGDAEIDHLTVKTLTTLQETILSQGSFLTLQAGVSDPSNPPTPSMTYTTRQFNDDGKWDERKGWSTDGTYWYTARAHGVQVIAERWTASGTLNASYAVTFSNTMTVTGSCVGPSGDFYVIATTGVAWAVYQFTASTMNYLHTNILSGSGTTAQEPDGFSRGCALGFDSVTGELLIAQARPNNSDKVRIRRYTPTTGSLFGTWGSFFDTDFAYSQDLSYILYGSFDLGASRYLFGNFVSASRVIDTSGTRQTTEEWSDATGGMRGMSWATVNVTGNRVLGSQTLTSVASTVGLATGMPFVGTGFPVGTIITGLTSNTITLNNLATSTFNGGTYVAGPFFAAVGPTGVCYSYETGNRTSGPTELWYASYVLTNGATKTRMSNIAAFTMKSRSRLTISMPNLINGTTGTEVYLARDSDHPGVVPDRAAVSMRKQGVGVGTPPKFTITKAVFGSNDNPTANAFGAATPARIRSSTGRTYMTGDDKFQAPDKFKSGLKVGVTTSATAQVIVTITFDQPFPAGQVPRVFCAMQTANTSTAVRDVKPFSVTENGFEMRIRYDAVTNINIAWFAIAPDYA